VEGRRELSQLESLAGQKWVSLIAVRKPSWITNADPVHNDVRVDLHPRHHLVDPQPYQSSQPDLQTPRRRLRKTRLPEGSLSRKRAEPRQLSKRLTRVRVRGAGKNHLPTLVSRRVSSPHSMCPG
jgi:hypothetical protein